MDDHADEFSPGVPEGARFGTGHGLRGFTLIELLAVIAIIGILASILIPTTMSVRASADRARTRILFQQWAAAVEGFRSEYGAFPVLASNAKVNGASSNDASSLHPFHDVLSGRRRSGAPLPDPGEGGEGTLPERQNPRRIAFLALSDAEIYPGNHEVPELRNLLRDPFGNTDIAVLVDANLDGVIDAHDYATLPRVSPPDQPGVNLVPSDADFPGAGVRAGVLFYAAPPGASDASQLILSWK